MCATYAREELLTDDEYLWIMSETVPRNLLFRQPRLPPAPPSALSDGIKVSPGVLMRYVLALHCIRCIRSEVRIKRNFCLEVSRLSCGLTRITPNECSFLHTKDYYNQVCITEIRDT